jgi:hypothetical protein
VGELAVVDARRHGAIDDRRRIAGRAFTESTRPDERTPRTSIVERPTTV